MDRGEAIIVDADFTLAETLPARLERYAIADDVQFEVLPSEATGFHVLGASAPGVRIRRLGADGTDVVTPPPGLPKRLRRRSELSRVARGVPRWGHELDEDTLPQEAGLERIAVDFRKRLLCWPGDGFSYRVSAA